MKCSLVGRSPVHVPAHSRAAAALIVTLVTILGFGLSGQGAPPRVTLTSSAFPDGGAIPDAYTCSGENVSPPLQWIGTPAATQSFALLVVDPDAPSGEFVHWVLYDLAPPLSVFHRVCGRLRIWMEERVRG